MSLPNQLTSLRIILAPLFYILFAVVDPPLYGWAVIVFIVAGITDWYDGYFARKLGKLSAFGAFYDPLADKILTSFAFIAFASKGLVPIWCVVLIIFRDTYLTLFRMLADSRGQSIKTSNFAKYKTFFQMTFISYLLIALMLADGYMGNGVVSFGQILLEKQVVWWLIVLITALTVLSAAAYTYDNFGTLKTIVKRPLYKNTQ